MVKRNRQKETARRDAGLLTDLDNWWPEDLEAGITLWQAARYGPHLYQSEHGELPRQKMRAWLERDWVWTIREQAQLGRGFARMMTRLMLTEQGMELLEALRRASEEPPA